MTLLQSLSAYTATQRLRNAALTYKELLALDKAAKALADSAKFYATEEQKLVEQYADKGEDGKPLIKDGRFEISDSGKRAEFLSKKQELNDTDSEYSAEKFTLNLSDSDAKLSLADLDALRLVAEIV